MNEKLREEIDDRIEVEKALRESKKKFKAILKGEPRDTVEYVALRKDGRSFPIVIHSTLVVRNGKPAGIRGIIIDLTEEKKSIEEQRQLEAKIAARPKNGGSRNNGGWRGP